MTEIEMIIGILIGLAAVFLLIRHLRDYLDYTNQRKNERPATIVELFQVGSGFGAFQSAKLTNGRLIDHVSTSFKVGDKVYVVNDRLWKK